MTDTATDPGPKADDKAAPSGPSLDEVRAVVREEIAGFFSGAFGPKDDEKTSPKVKLPTTEKELEAYTENLTRSLMERLAADEKGKGKPTPEPEIDPTPEPEIEPEGAPTWADRVRKWVWE